MADAGKTATEKKIAKLDKQLQEVYSEAYKDLDKKFNDFYQKLNIKSDIYMKKLKNGEITKEQYNSWYDGQVFQGDMWEAKRDEIAKTMTNTNKIAMDMINGGKVDVFAENANWTAYELEHGEGLNFGFGLYDATTVTKLIKDNPKMLPEWKINEPKDYIWNEKKVNRSVTQGIIQGESLDKVTKRLVDGLVTQNENHMKMFARTAMTGAQNAGRDQRLMEAKSKGITVVKQWMATLDDHTRDSHAEIDGETIKVGDKWHPIKFSNGCRYPADPEGPPQEVYNCRCTLVGDVEDYPSEYERYDNIDGVPIENMTYNEWKELKAQQAIEQEKQAIYSLFGGEENYKILSKYEDFEDLLNHTTPSNYDEFQKISDAFGGDNTAIDKAIKEANNLKTPEEKQYEKELKQYEKDLEKYKNELEAVKDAYEDITSEIEDVGADKVFSGIWYNQDVTYADWEAKKDSIEAKKEYYNSQMEIYKEAGNWSMYGKMESKLELLNEFEQHGEEYSKLLEEQKEALKALKDFEKTKPNAPIDPNAPMIGSFSADAYSQERKDDALWALRSEDADNALRDKCGEVWQAAPDEEKDAVYEYTVSYSKFNEPLRGWEYGQSNYSTGDGFKGVGNTDLNAGNAQNGNYLNAMTDIISKSTYDQDVWLNRGCDFKGMDKFFNCDIDLLKYGTQEELENALLGTTPTEYGFMSCGSSKGKGFKGDIKLNIYAPAGTQMMYVEPFSGFGQGDGRSWDGVSKQSHLGNELETILQQGTQFRVTKIERSNGTLYFDLEVIDQSNQQRWEP